MLGAKKGLLARYVQTMPLVKSVDLNILSPDEIRKLSVVEVTETTIYDRILPKNNGINDHRMGTVDRRIRCGTCGHGVERCVGHPGHIELPIPVFHVGYRDTLLKVLRCVCFFCSRLLCSAEDSKIKKIVSREVGKTRFAYMATALKSKKKCPHCGGPQPAYAKVGLNITTTWQKEVLNAMEPEDVEFVSRPFGAEEVLQILRHITDDDHRAMGFSPDKSRPEWMVQTAMLVPPPIIRPSILVSEGSRARGQDDLTNKLKDIVKACHAIREAQSQGLDKAKSETGVKNWQKLVAALQFHVSTYVNNEIRGQKQSVQRSGAPTKCVFTRLKGKEGRIRGNLMGKRVNGTARAVISPDPEMDMDCVGIPHKVAMTLTIQERVNSFNYNWLSQLVQAGPFVLNGAKSVTTDKGEVFDLEFYPHRDRLRLHYGWTVARFLREGDYVAFNRQPSLHKQSLMGHKVLIRPGNTCRLNPSCCSVYNADFDGDEMNVHVVGGPEATSELSDIMAVPHQLLGPSANRPMMGLVQDALVGSFLFTNRSTFLTRGQVMQLMMCMHHSLTDYTLPSPAILRPQQLWTGKQVFALLLPDVDYEKYVRDGEAKVHKPERPTWLTKLKATKPQNSARKYPKETPSAADKPLVTDGKENGVLNDAAKTEYAKYRSQKAEYTAYRLKHPTWRRYIEACRNGHWIPEPNIDPVDDAQMHTDERYVLIQRGEYITGTMCKKSLGATGNGLIHLICSECGPHRTVKFISDTQRVINRWMIWRGFSVGIGDCIPSVEVNEKVENIIQKSLAHVDYMHAQSKVIGVSSKKIESAVSKVLSDVLNKVGGAVQSELSLANGINCMVTSGSKGNPMNIAQILGTVGQQSVDGGRIRAGENGTDPVLPCYSKGEETPVSHGFVCNSYLLGLTPEECFFHAMGGREGLVDTSVKTAATGYFQRKIMKGMESLKVEYDYTVRNAEGQIVEFAYGTDNLDASLMKEASLDLVMLDNRKLESRFLMTYTQLVDAQLTPEAPDSDWEALVKLELEHGKYYRDRCRASKLTLLTPVLDTKIYCAANVPQLLSRAVSKFRIAKTDKSNLTVAGVIKKVADLCGNIMEMCGAHNTSMICGLIVSHLCAKNLICVRRLSAEALDWLINEIWRSYLRARVQPGEMVGAIAAESCGEPCTQMTLNTFHSAGIGEKNIGTSGIPRMKELIDVAKRMKTPICTIHMVPLFASNEKATRSFMYGLIYTTFGDIVSSSVNIWDPLPLGPTVVPEDEWIVKTYAALWFGRDHSGACGWITRFVLDRNECLKRGIRPRHVAQAIQQFSGDQLIVQTSETNAIQWIVRVRVLRIKEPMAAVVDDLIEFKELSKSVAQRIQNSLMNDVVICGVPGITGASLRKLTRSELNAGTGEISTKQEFVIDTQGTALQQLMLSECVRWQRTTSNDVQEVESVLGLEAAVTVIFHEIKRVLSFDGTYVNDRHIMEIVNAMTCRGYLMPMSRHGINRIDTGYLVRSSFEETVEVLLEAAAFAERDPVKGVTERIMVGQLASVGTGMVSILDEPQPEAVNTPSKPRIIQTMVTETNFADECSENDACDYDSSIEDDISAERGITNLDAMGFSAPFQNANCTVSDIRETIAMASRLTDVAASVHDPCARQGNSTQPYRPSSPILQSSTRNTQPYRPSSPILCEESPLTTPADDADATFFSAVKTLLDQLKGGH